MICEQCGSDMEEESTIYRRFFKCYECEWEYEYYYDQESRSIYHNRKPAFRHNQLPGVKNDNHFTPDKKPYYHNNMKGDLFNDDYNDM